MSRSRKVIFNTHMAVGLCAAVFLAVMGITGAFLAYEYELDRAFNPKLFIVAAQRASPSAFLASVRGIWRARRESNSRPPDS